MKTSVLNSGYNPAAHQMGGAHHHAMVPAQFRAGGGFRSPPANAAAAINKNRKGVQHMIKGAGLQSSTVKR